MRTTVDLIHELEHEAEGALAAGLVVGFENTTLFVTNDEPQPLAALNEMIRSGGKPVGIYRFWREDKEGVFTIRPLQEYAGNGRICDYLRRLGNGVEILISDRQKMTGRTTT